MPLLFRENIDGVVVAVWKVEEQIGQLLEWLDDHEVENELDMVRSVRRKLEIAASRYLFKYVSGADYEHILHDEEGKPFLASRKYDISISHTEGYVALSLGCVKSGIDIERITDRAYRSVSHFLSDSEICTLNKDNPYVDAVVRWSVKESVYKVIGKGVYNFKETIHTQAFCPESDRHVTAVIRTDAEGKLSKDVLFRIYDDFVLTLCF